MARVCDQSRRPTAGAVVRRHAGWPWGPLTALGDEVNEGARIEACAYGGRMLASKSLLERLSREDAEALAIEPDHIRYIPLADLPTALECGIAGSGGGDPASAGRTWPSGPHQRHHTRSPDADISF